MDLHFDSQTASAELVEDIVNKLVDSVSSDMLVSGVRPCMPKNISSEGEIASCLLN